MADKKEAKVRVRAGVLPEVREIRRPDFTKKAADIEKAEAERVLNQGDAASDEAQAAAVAQSLEAQVFRNGQDPRQRLSGEGIAPRALPHRNIAVLEHIFRIGMVLQNRKGEAVNGCTGCLIQPLQSLPFSTGYASQKPVQLLTICCLLET